MWRNLQVQKILRLLCLYLQKVFPFSDGTYHKRIRCSPPLDQKIERTCNVCSKELSSELNLKQHKIAKHGPGAPEVPCPVCGKHVKYLDMHVKVVFEIFEIINILDSYCRCSTMRMEDHLQLNASSKDVESR